MSNFSDSEVEAMTALLKEIRSSHISDRKSQSDVEAGWCKEIDRILGKDACGLFSLDFDDGASISPEGDIHILRLFFDSKEEAEIALEQLMGLLRAFDTIRDYKDVGEDDRYLDKLLVTIDKMMDLRHGEVSI